ncbi:hypothetical protein CEXT_493361 [Caerostris extrusa]|uniref:Uncharacterized protein n=1 Tax=Caerostris extrusa TaxID=172846 RepID=A0AAV4XW60_CAEEX|nr:hypothetical protein CEXT_493361 [Caerostris extrusa]
MEEENIMFLNSKLCRQLGAVYNRDRTVYGLRRYLQIFHQSNACFCPIGGTKRSGRIDPFVLNLGARDRCRRPLFVLQGAMDRGEIGIDLGFKSILKILSLLFE